uniref:Uncharacterized protein n=1 Tax=Trichuris muris TaxID=70415 RepID=A0A5S6QRV6_TRIMR
MQQSLVDRKRNNRRRKAKKVKRSKRAPGDSRRCPADWPSGQRRLACPKGPAPSRPAKILRERGATARAHRFGGRRIDAQGGGFTKWVRKVGLPMPTGRVPNVGRRRDDLHARQSRRNLVGAT